MKSRNGVPSGELAGTVQAFWGVFAVFAALSTLTIISFVRPDWMQFALFSASFIAFLLSGIAAVEVWTVWRGPRY